MRKLTLAALRVGLAVALGTACYGQSSDGQSLGDVARKQRQKQQAKDTQAPPKKVITNEDLPANSDSSAGSSGASSSGKAKPAEPDFQPPSGGPTVEAAAEVKAQIQAQKDTVASLQDRIEKLNSSIHFVQSNLYYNGAEYNAIQRQKQQEVEQLKKQLEQEKQRLQHMQDAARKAGFGSAVYDP